MREGEAPAEPNLAIPAQQELRPPSHLSNDFETESQHD